MSDDTKVRAELRTNFGKGFARRLRAAGKIPAVLYGHGTEPVHLALPGHQVSLIIRRANALLDLDIEGTPGLALVKDVQKDPVHQVIEHIDLLVVRRGEKLQVDVPIIIVGESFSGTIATLDTNTLTVEVAATSIPENIEVDVEGLEEGAHILASDVTLPAGASLITDPEQLIVAVSVPAVEQEGEDELQVEADEVADEQAAASE